MDGRRHVVVWKQFAISAFFSCDREDFAHTETEKVLKKNGRRKQKSGSMEKAGLYRANRCGRVQLPDGNGLVPYENERHGPHEMRRTAERVWLRKPDAVQDRDNGEAGERAVSLAVAAPRTRVSGASGRKRSARIAFGFEPAQVSGEEPEKPSRLPLPCVRRPKSLRRSPVPQLLACLREKMTTFRSFQSLRAFRNTHFQKARCETVLSLRCVSICLET